MKKSSSLQKYNRHWILLSLDFNIPVTNKANIKSLPYILYIGHLSYSDADVLFFHPNSKQRRV